jgi:hypothetical protein
MDGHTKGLQNWPRRLTGQNVRTQKKKFYIFCFFIFVNLREGGKNPTKKIQKKRRSKYVRTDGRTHRGVAESASQINGSEHQDTENKYFFIFTCRAGSAGELKRRIVMSRMDTQTNQVLEIATDGFHGWV